MRILNRGDIESLFSMTDAIEAAKAAYAVQSANQVDAPVRQRVAGATAQDAFLFMPGAVKNQAETGIKIVSVFPGNKALNMPVVAATMLLLDSGTGKALCLMDGTALTQLRTGAASGAATDLLALPEASIAAVFGTGGQALRQIEALLTVRKLEEVRIYSRTSEQRKAFAEAMGRHFEGRFGAKMIEAASPEEAVAGADIVSAATSSHTPVFEGRWLKPGAHVNGVGSFTLSMQELDEDTLNRAHRIYIDAWDACEEEAGDIMIPLNAGRFRQEQITGELGQLIGGTIPGRTAREQITVFKSVGIAPQDIVTAGRIYRKAVAAGMGQMVDF